MISHRDTKFAKEFADGPPDFREMRHPATFHNF